MQGQGSNTPMSGRDPKSPAELSALTDRVVKLIVANCGADDAIMVAVIVVKLIGELAKYECGEEAVVQMLTKATEEASRMRVQLSPLAADSKPPVDPFVIEPKDPFSIPE